MVAGHLFGRVLALVTQVILARILGPASFGLYTIGLTTVKLGGRVSQWGLDKGVVRFGSEFRDSDPASFSNTIRQSILFAVVAGFGIGGVIFVLAPWMSGVIFQDAQLAPALKGFAPAIGLYAGLRVAAAATTITQDMRYRLKVQDLIQPGLEMAFIGLVFVFSWGLLGAILALLLSTAIAFIVAVVDVKRLYPEVTAVKKHQHDIRGDLLRFSTPVALAAVLSIASSSTDRYLLGALRSVAEVGIYQAAAQSSVLFTMILASFNAIFMPMIADLEAAGDRTRLQTLYGVSTKWGLYVSLPFFVVMVLMPAEILSFVFGGPYTEGKVVMVILALGQLVNLSTGAVGLLLIMNGRTARWNQISAAMLISNIALGLALIPTMGMLGASIATSMAVSGQYAVGLYFVRREIGLWPYDARYAKGIFAALFSGLVVLILRLAADLSLFLLLSTAILMSAGAFVLALAVLGLDEEDTEVFRAVQRRARALLE